MSKRLKDKVAIITGGSRGIGYATADAFLKEGARVIITASSEESANKAVEKLKEKYPDSIVAGMSPDLSNYESVRNAFIDATTKYGCVDILVNNAGANVKKDKVVDIDLSQLRYMFELNCISALGMIQGVYSSMKERQAGLIINILSSCCLFNNPMTGAYSASKDAMEGLSKILLKEVKSENIGVCNVYPGGVDTAFRANRNTAYLKPVTVAKMIKNCMENEEGCVHDLVLRPFVEDNIC